MVRLIGRSLYSMIVVEDFWDVYFNCVTVESRVVDSNMNGFSSSLATCLVSQSIILKGEMLPKEWLLEILFVDFTGVMTIVFFYSIFQASTGFSYVGKVTVFF